MSSPPLKGIDLDSLLMLSPEKLSQRLGSLSKQGAKDLQAKIENAYSEAQKGTLNSLIDNLEKERVRETENRNPVADIDKEIQQLEVKIRKVSRGIEIGQQLKAREALQAKLDAQPAWVAYGAAALASCGSTLVAHPIDTYKTLQQTGADKEAGLHADAKRAAAMPASGKVAAGETASGTAALGAWASEVLPPGTSFGDLYRGLVPNIVKEAPSSALYLGIYELVRGRLNGPGGLLSANPLLGYLVAGAVGELVGSVVRAPSEACKTKMQSGGAESVGDAVRQVVLDRDGRKNTVRAWASSLLRDVPMGAVQIAIFELLKAYLIQSPEFDFDTNSLQAEAAFGSIGGVIGALLTTPADVVTIRILTSQEGGASAQDSEPMGALAVAQQIYAEEGLPGFASGAMSRGLYWAPAIGIFLSLYCSLRQMATTLPPPFT